MKFQPVLSTVVPPSPATSGHLIAAIDGTLWVDTADYGRIGFSGLVQCATIAERDAIEIPSTGKLYCVTQDEEKTNVLYYWSGEMETFVEVSGSGLTVIQLPNREAYDKLSPEEKNNGTLYLIEEADDFICNIIEVYDDTTAQTLSDEHPENVYFVEDDANHGFSPDSYSNPSPSLVDFGSLPVGTTFDEMTFGDYLTAQHYPDIPPGVTITASEPFGVYELGLTFQSWLFVTYTMTKHPVCSVKLFQNNVEFRSVQESNFVNFNPVSDTISTRCEVNGSVNVTFRVDVCDMAGLVTTMSGLYEFVNPMYIGSVADTVTAATITKEQVKAMTKHIAKPSNQSMSYTFTKRKFAIWVPDTWSAVKRILDQNSLDMTMSFGHKSLSIQNAAGTPVDGKVYVLESPTSQNEFNVTYYFE